MADKPKFKGVDKKPSGGEGGSDMFWPVIIITIFIALAINRAPWGARWLGTASSTPSGLADGVQYSDPSWPITFQYPSDWKINKVDSKLNISSPSGEIISMGGSKVKCSDFAGTDTSCRTVVDTPLYTSAKDAISRSAFDLISQSM